MNCIKEVTVVLFFLIPTWIWGQHEDCDIAQVICSDGQISFNSEGTGTNDFFDPGNDPGCLETLENQSSWYYFEFNTDMPPNSMIEFTIDPNGGFSEDYDFAVYGPDVPCDNLGEPVRCSFANFLCDLCPLTGLGMGATDNSEGAQNEDGFVAPMTVQPGEGFYMILDNWYGSSDGFTLTWGGSAAAYLNCNANPACNNLVVNAGIDLNVCAGDSLNLSANLANASPNATVVWTDTTGANLFLSDSTALAPTFYPPSDAEGNITFMVTVMDGECQQSDFVTIGISPTPEVTIEGDSLYCPNTTANLESNTSFVAYEWSTTATTESIEIDTAGTYWLLVEDANGCFGADTMDIIAVAEPTPVIEGDAQICDGDSTTLTLATNYDAFLWDDSSTEPALTVFNAGDYEVVVTDSNGCTAAALFSLEVNALPQPTIVGEDAICDGDTATLSTSILYNNYQWSTSLTEPEIEVQAEGNYGVTVTDGNGCVGEADIFLTVNSLPIPSMLTGPDFCPGDSTPIRVNVGYAAYLWPDGTDVHVLYAHEGGSYTVTVTNSNGCQGTGTVEVGMYEAPTPEIVGDTAFCAGDILTLSAETSYAAYLWSDGSTNPSLDVSNGGAVNVTVTDGNGCQGNAFVDITENALPIPSIAGETSFCTGEMVSLSAAESWQTYQWSNGQNTADISVEEGGNYTLTVTDENSCVGEADLFLTENNPPIPSMLVGPAFCPGDSTPIRVNVGYAAYLWPDGTDINVLYAHEAGSYTVTVTDNNGCEGTGTVEVVDFDAPTPSIVGDSAFCAGDILTLTAETSYAAYLWSDGSTNPNLEVTNGGLFNLTITDDNGCQGNASLEVTENPLPMPTIAGETGFCPGETLSLSSGESWQTYQWSSGQNTADISVDEAGVFVLTVTDENNCTNSTSQNIEAFPAPIPEIIGALQFCPGESTTLSTTEAYAAYSWNGNTADPMLEVSTAGNINLVVTDSNGCMATTSEQVTIFQVDPPDIPNQLGFCSGTSIEVEAGANYLSYLWSDTSTNPEITITQAGQYGITVTDQNDCVSSTGFLVEAFALPQPEIQGVEGLCPGDVATLGVADTFENYLWSNGSVDPTLNIDTPGTYELLVVDQNTCEGTATFQVLAYQNPEPDIVGASAFCPDETIELGLTQNYATYQWTGDINTPTLDVSNAGIIEVLVTNEAGCGGQASIEITALSTPEFSINGDTTFCTGGNTLLSVPSQFMDYQWAPGGSFPELQVDQPGSYSVTITNTDGCMSSQAIEVYEIPLPLVDPGLDQTLDCLVRSVNIGGNTPLPQDQFTYLWTGPGIISDNQNEPQPEIDTPGTYELVVQDDLYGCFSEVTSIIVTDLSYQPNIFIADPDTLNCVVSNTIIDGTLSDNNQDIQFYWRDENGLISTSADALLTVTEGGWYYLDLQDTLTGCMALDSVFVEEDRIYPEIQIEDPDQISCYEPEVLIHAEQSSLGAAFAYQWESQDGAFQSGQSSLTPVVNEGGWYELQIENILNGCTTIDSILVIENTTPPIAQAGADESLDCIIRSLQLDATGSSQGPGFVLEWTDEQGMPIAGQNNLSPEVDEPGTYFLMVLNQANGCMTTDEVTISDIADYPVLAEVEVLHPDCFGDADGQISVLEVENGTPPFTYALDSEAYSSEGIFRNLPAASYQVLVEDAAGCVSSVFVAVDEGNPILVDLGPNRQINLGETLTLEPILVQPGSGLIQYDWVSLEGDTCFDCKEWRLMPFETGEVQVIATDERGCQTNDIMTIFVARRDEVFIPNAFSPNDDGINDFFMVYSGEDVSMVRSIMIMDRWGEKMFETAKQAPNDIAMGWDGKFRGQRAIPSVYVYVIEVEFIDGRTKVFKGDVTLIR